MRLERRNKPKIKTTTTKKDGFSGWLKCTHCGELVHANELERNLNTCPKCSYHYRIAPEARVRLLSDPDSFQELFTNLSSCDPLDFVDTQRYCDRLREAQEKSGQKEAIITGRATIRRIDVALGVMDFDFMGGSMGSCVGEKVTRLIEYAKEEHIPLVICSGSGGARMQESTLSLMQMAKVCAALSKFQKEGLPYISILTNPTTGGVTASFASLGDIIIAEPKALICFAGPRVIEQLLGKPLPVGAQQSEFLLKHGMIDLVVERGKLRDTIADLLEFTTPDLHSLTHEETKKWTLKIL
jgi:acetyl-CoA carboxylase carboxyl transferase subunit beta